MPKTSTPGSTSDEYAIDELLENDAELEATLSEIHGVERQPAGHWTDETPATKPDPAPQEEAEEEKMSGQDPDRDPDTMTLEEAGRAAVETLVEAEREDARVREEEARIPNEIEAFAIDVGDDPRAPEESSQGYASPTEEPVDEGDIVAVVKELRRENQEIKAQFSQLIQLVNQLAPLAQQQGGAVPATQPSEQGGVIDRDIPTGSPGGTGIMEFLASRGQAAPAPAQPGDNGSNLPAPAGQAQPQAQPQLPQMNFDGFFSKAWGLIKLAKEVGWIGQQPVVQQQQNMSESMKPFLEMFQMYGEIMNMVRGMVLNEANASSQYMARIAKSVGREFLVGGVQQKQGHGEGGGSGLPASAAIVNPNGGVQQ